MSTIKISELASSAISLTDFFAKADANGIANKNTVQELSNFLNTVGTLAFRGVLLSADAAVTEDGIYVAGGAGTYTNNGGLVITLINQIVLISITESQTIFEKVEIPVNINSNTGVFDVLDNSEAATQASTYNYLKNGLANLSIIRSNSKTFNGSSISSVNYTFFNKKASTETGTVTEVKVNCVLAGEISVLIINAARDTIISEKVLQIALGTSTTDLNIPINEGEYVAIYLNTAKVSFNIPGTNSDYGVYGKLSASPVLANNRDIDFSFKIDYLSISQLINSKIVYNTSKLIVENERDFSEWTNTGFTTVNNIIQSTTDGQYLTSPNYYGITNRLIEVVIQPLSSTSKFIIASFANVGVDSGSAIRVNLTNNTIEILSRYSGTIGSVVTTYTPSFTLTVNVKYRIEIELASREIKIKIAEENTTDGFKIFNDYEVLGTKISTPYGYSTYPSYGYSVGNLQGFLRLINEQGGVKVLALNHTLKNSKSPLIYFAGDSITEGFSVDDNSKFGGLLKEHYGDTSVCVSGIGGDKTATAINRITAEFLKMSPQIFIPFFGSNTESINDFTNGMTALINLGISKGCKVILCTIPTSSDLTTVINTLAFENSLEVIDFRTVLTNNGTVYADFYDSIDANGNSYTDQLHPNPLGHYFMFNEIVSKL